MKPTTFHSISRKMWILLLCYEEEQWRQSSSDLSKIAKGIWLRARLVLHFLAPAYMVRSLRYVSHFPAFWSFWQFEMDIKGTQGKLFSSVLRTTSFINRCHPNVYTTSMALSVIVNGKKTLWLSLNWCRLLKYKTCL